MVINFIYSICFCFIIYLFFSFIIKECKKVYKQMKLKITKDIKENNKNDKV